MAKDGKKGVLVVSVDLQPEQFAETEHPKLNSVCGDLCRLFLDYQLQATWAFAKPAQSSTASQLYEQGHEVAILGESSWLGASPNRAHLVRGLAVRLDAARAAGLPASSLALQGVHIQRHFDLLVKFGLTALRNCNTPRAKWKVFRRRAVDAPLALRYGLWSFPPTLEVPGETTAARAKQTVDRAIRQGGVCQLVVDAVGLADDRPGLGRLETILRHAERCRRMQRLDIKSLHALTRELAAERCPVRPSQSLLRAA